MEETTNLLIEKSQEVQDDVTDFSLELLRDKIEYLDVKADFFENQTVLINKIICKIELVNKELLKEEQELTDKLEKKAKVKKNLVNILNGLKSQQKMKMHETKENEALVRTNGFYYCPECPYKTKYDRTRLKDHINAVHRKLKPWKCSDCTKGFSSKSCLSQHRLIMHNTNKGWICDCCGSRFGIKKAMKQHMMSHLPPSFSCSECDKKFLYSGDLNNHKKLHRGILIEICKLCNKGYVTKARLRDHIIQNHFEKLDCEVSGCSSSLSFKTNYKNHLKSVHKKDDQTFIGKLLEKLQKQKPNFQQLKYVKTID